MAVNAITMARNRGRMRFMIFLYYLYENARPYFLLCVVKKIMKGGGEARKNSRQMAGRTDLW